jgi:hypothetical protein
MRLSKFDELVKRSVSTSDGSVQKFDIRIVVFSQGLNRIYGRLRLWGNYALKEMLLSLGTAKEIRLSLTPSKFKNRSMWYISSKHSLLSWYNTRLQIERRFRGAFKNNKT